MLTYPRVGSNYLCAALNHTGQFKPPFQEWINPRVSARNEPDCHLTTTWEPWLKIKEEFAYHEDVGLLLDNLPRHLKVHNFDYSLYFNLEHVDEIQKKLPDIKFIRLRRRDQIACAVSYYLATNTGVFESLDHHVMKHSSISVPIDKDELLKCRQWVYWWDKYWEDFVNGTDHIEIFYEDLVSDIEVIQKAHSYLGISVSWAKRVMPIIGERKLKHPQTNELISILKEGE